jgi:hypothetical protein
MIQLFLDDENNNDSIGDAKGKNIFLSPTMTSCMTTCAGSTSISHSIIFYRAFQNYRPPFVIGFSL